jgi:hypothetical protein
MLDVVLGAALALSVVILIVLAKLAARARGELAYLREDRQQLSGDVDKLATMAKHWERRFWSLHRAVEQLIGERDGWKATYSESVQKHLNGQAVLEQGLTKSRAANVALVRLVNAERERRKRIIELAQAERVDAEAIVAVAAEAPTRPLSDAKLESLDAYPRGKVEAYFNDIVRWNEQAKKSQAELVEQLGADRAHWDEHFAALASPAPPSSDGARVPLPAESLDGLTVQEIREV